MNILGVYAGIGSPLIGAKLDGHNIVGNIDPRSFVHYTDDQGRNTFDENFIGSLRYKVFPRTFLPEIDIVCGHPKCGMYSQLINKSGEDRRKYSAQKSKEFEEFIRIVSLVKPKMAFFDNLPKSLAANSIAMYIDRLPDYDIHIEYISNYFYGNSQKNRNRIFVIATLKDLEFKFKPNETPNGATIRTTIGDLFEYEGTGLFYNHEEHSVTAKSNSGRRVFQDDCMTWGQVKSVFKNQIDNKALHYINKDGELKYHFGFRKAQWDRPAGTLIGTHPQIHPGTFLPMSIRERARIQGFPDDFVFYGTRFEDDGTWVHNKNTAMIQQTGRCIPCEFPRYLIAQFDAHLKGLDFKYSGERLAKLNKHVAEAFQTYKDYEEGALLML